MNLDEYGDYVEPKKRRGTDDRNNRNNPGREKWCYYDRHYSGHARHGQGKPKSKNPWKHG